MKSTKSPYQRRDALPSFGAAALADGLAVEFGL